MQPIKFFYHPPTPNPSKVHILLVELGLPFEKIHIELSGVKDPSYTQHNPNGRLPTIIDPNTNITIWESGAIIHYLVSTYDKEHKLSFEPGSHDAFHAMQYLMFQMSGQGPYFGQAGWFTHYHPTPVPSARERYINEIRRVTSVLDKCLEDKEYLVGGKCSFADLSFVSWYWGLERIDFDGKIGFRAELEEKNPNWKAWLARLEAREGVTKVREEMIAAYMASQKKVGDEADEKTL